MSHIKMQAEWLSVHAASMVQVEVSPIGVDNAWEMNASGAVVSGVDCFTTRVGGMGRMNSRCVLP